MKEAIKVCGLIVFVAIIGFSMAALSLTGCDNGSGGDANLSGSISISPVSATIGQELTATYTGNETVSYQWKNGENNVGTNSNKYIPVEFGSYTVTVSATGYNSKTSTAVTVNPALFLSGTISIMGPPTSTTGQELTAIYTGIETVSYQWKNGTNNVGTNSNKYTPSVAGSYTVTVSASGYSSKTSTAVTVTVPVGPSPTHPLFFTFNSATRTITGYSDGGPKDVVIPATIDGIPVTAIGNNAFSDRQLTSVFIPNSVTFIGDSAFSGNQLTSVTIGANVTLATGISGAFGNNGFETFYNNIGRTANTYSVYRTAWYKTSGDFAYSGTTIIRYIGSGGAVEIPTAIDGIPVAAIGDSAFWRCTSLTSIIIPDSVTSIGDSAFEGCTSLASVTIGNSVTSIGNVAFYNCSGLTSVTIPDSVTSIGERAFSSCTSLASVTIGNSVTSIGNMAFYNCSGLTSVTIPDSVTSIGTYAFQGCTGLTSIEVNANNTTYTSENGILYNKNKTILLSYPAGKTDSSYTIPDSVTSIGDSAFRGCTSLASVTIGNSVTSIGDSAFRGCTGLTSITIPDSVTSIGSYAFSGCTSITSITIGADVSIGNFFDDVDIFISFCITYNNYGKLAGTYKVIYHAPPDPWWEWSKH